MSAQDSWLVVATLFTGVSMLNLRIGWTHRGATSGSRGRLFFAAAYIGMLDILPFVVWAAVPGLEGSNRRLWLFFMALGCLYFNLLTLTAYLRPPVWLRGTHEQFPLVTDPGLLKRVADLAGCMRLPVSIIRLWPSISSSQQVLAYVGTLQAPQLVVTDGIVQRLDSIECDAIVAHELAHVANRTLWISPAVRAISSAIATGLVYVMPPVVAAIFGLLLLSGLVRIVTRVLEYDCDRRAARVLGFRTTVSALTKIHAVHSIANSGIVSLLFYAMATHPSRDARLWALHQAAPADDMPEISIPRAMVRQQRFAVAAAFAMWLMALGATLVLPQLLPEGLFILAIFPALAALATPRVLMSIAGWKAQRLDSVRLHGLPRKRRWIYGGLFVAVIVPAIIIVFSHDRHFDPHRWSENLWLLNLSRLILMGTVAGVGGSLWRRRKIIQLKRKQLVALHVHDFARAIDLCEAEPGVAARDNTLRYNLATARAVSGDSERAIAELETLWNEKPDFGLGALLLGNLLLEAERPESALAMAEALEPRLPNDIEVSLLKIRSLRRLGRLDEAQAECDRALVLAPDKGTVDAFVASVAMDRGDIPAARKLLDRALERQPGHALVLLAQAELAILTEPAEIASGLVERAVQALDGTPFLFVKSDAARIRKKLGTNARE